MDWGKSIDLMGRAGRVWNNISGVVYATGTKSLTVQNNGAPHNAVWCRGMDNKETVGLMSTGV